MHFCLIWIVLAYIWLKLGASINPYHQSYRQGITGKDLPDYSRYYYPTITNNYDQVGHGTSQYSKEARYHESDITDLQYLGGGTSYSLANYYSDYGYSASPMSSSARIGMMYGQSPAMFGYGFQLPVYNFPMVSSHTSMITKKKTKDKDMDEDEKYPKKKKKKKKYKRKKKKRPKKVYVPIIIKKTKKKKKKIIAVHKGFYIPGGLQVFGKFKSIKDCKKLCAITPYCFAADFNPWLKKCYVHTNVTACNNMKTHPKLIHFKKVPCDLVETPRGLIILGVRVHGGLEQKGVKNLQDCIKRCATAGQGIAPNTMQEEKDKQVCFGIDYDFATHKCYLHTDEDLCPDVIPIPTPVQTVEAPSNILILLCPRVLI